MSDHLYAGDARRPAPEWRAALRILSDPTPRPSRPVTCPKFAAMLAAYRASLGD